MTQEFQENAIGIEVTIELVDETDTALNLTDVTAIDVKLSTPMGDSKDVTATPTNPSTPEDGLATFFTTDGLLVPAGDWDIQAFVTYTGGDKIPTKVAAFKVKQNIQ